MPDPQHLAALKAEAERSSARRNADPYDRTAREELARALLEMDGERFPRGSVERGHILLLILSEAFPIPGVRSAYMSNLESLLVSRALRAAPGRVVLGLGSGRCGSTTLTALLRTVVGSCSTHENPPFVYWTPLDEQVAFHLGRMERLARSFALVFDAAHWWINALDAFFARFPEGKVIGLVREADACAESFLSIKGRGRGTFNHWVEPGNALWQPHHWDPVYPTYPSPEGAAADPEGAKRALIRRYVVEYNARLAEWGERFPERVLLTRTEELSRPEAQQKIFDFVGVTGRPFDKVLNAGKIKDGNQAYWF